MLKCPSCGKRVLGQDLVTGDCSHCGQRLGGSLDSSQIEKRSGDPSSDTIDPVTIRSPGKSSIVGDRTVVLDEEPAVDPVATSLSDKTIVADDDGSSDPSTASATTSDQTLISDDYELSPPSTATVVIDPESADKTLVLDEELDSPAPVEAGAQTVVIDSDEGSVNRGTATDQTFISDDVPESLLKTVQNVWGDEDEASAAARPDMTLKAKEDIRPAKATKQTLVIKTKALVETRDLPESHDPEYELIRILGEGGMGIVYDARQTSIDRSVALKMIKGEAATNDKQKAKFLAEVVVTGDLDHPNIVPIYDVGENSQGNLFYSMKKVQGTPWQKVIAAKSLAENLDILMRTADAVGFAHARGIVHRDLKPENIMLGEFGEVLVMDWGLAHPLAGFRKSRSITGSASMGGTPAYMAPEMATGPIDRIGPASDVYLLGAILYEILTGGPPHVSKNVMKCLMAAARNEIAPTEKTGELVEIALRAMATDPHDRYQEVKEFQAAIRDYQSHSESVLLSSRAADDLDEARQTNDYQHYSRALFGFQEAFELWNGNKRAVNGISEAKLAYATSAKQKGDYDLGLSLLDEDRPEHSVLRQELLEAQNDRVARQKRLIFLKRAAKGLVAAVLIIVTGAAAWIRSEQKKAVAEATRATTAERVAINEKGKAVAAAEQEKQAKLLAVAAEQEAVKQRMAADAQRMIAETERSKAIEAQKLEETAKLAAVESAQQEQKAKLAALASEKAAIAAEKVAVAEREKAEQAKLKEEYESYISKIGLAASQIDKNAFGAAEAVLESCKPELRNWEWGRLKHLCSQSERTFDAAVPLESLAIDEPRKRFAAGGWDGTVRVWDLESGQVLATLPHGGEYVNAVAFSPDGQYLATGCNEPGAFIQIWKIETEQRVRVISGHTDEVLSLAYSRDGSQLLSSSYDKTARLWSTTDGRELRQFAGHTWWVWSAAFSVDERQIVTAGHDGTVIVWDVATGTRKPAFSGHRGPVFAAAFSPDGKQVVSAGYDRRVLLWSPAAVQSFDYKNLTTGADGTPPTFVTFEGHQDAVRSVEFSADGTMLLSGSQDNTVRVWDVATRREVTAFRGHGQRVQAAVFLNDGKRILSASHDQTVREWSVAGYEELRTLQGRVLSGHTDAVLATAYSRDQKQIVTASRDRTARLWNTSTGAPGPTLTEGHAYLASTAVFFPDGRRLLTAAVDNTARIWDVSSGGELLRLDHSGRSAAAAISHKAQWIATGGDDHVAQLWDAATGQRLKALAAHRDEVTAVAFSPDDRWLATGDTMGHVKLWEVATGQVTANLDGHSRRISAITFTDDGSRLLTASGDNTIGQWDIATGKELAPLILKHPDGVLAMRTIPGSSQVVSSCADRTIRLWDASKAQTLLSIGPLSGDIYSLSVSADGQRLLTADSENRIVQLWDLTTGREVQSPRADGTLGPLVDLKRQGGLLWSTAFVPGRDDVLTVGGSDARLWSVKTGRETMSFSPHGAVATVAFSPQGDRVVTGSWDNSAKIWSTQTGRVIRKLEGGHQSFVNTAVFSPDGNSVLTASDDGTALIWNQETGAVTRSLTGHKDRVRAALYSPDGETILTTSNDSTARLWKAATGELLREFTGHRFAVLCAAFSQDGQRLITGGEDNTARVWNVTTGELVFTLAGHTASVAAVAISPDGTRIISGSQDHVAKLWDAKTGQEILTLSHHTEDVTSVAFSPVDGRQILTGSRDGTAVIWLSQDWAHRPAVAIERVPARP